MEWCELTILAVASSLSDVSNVITSNKRPRLQLLPSDEMIEPRPLGQKRAKIYGIAENERRPFEFDASKKPKSFGIKQTFGMKPLRFSLKENGEEYMIGSEVSFFKLEQSSI